MFGVCSSMAVVEFSGLTKYSQHFIVHNFESCVLSETGTERLDFLAKML
jgi:hypothetical protein